MVFGVWGSGFGLTLREERDICKFSGAVFRAEEAGGVVCFIGVYYKP